MDITARSIALAADRVRPHIRHTPCLTVEVPTPFGLQAVVLKLESMQVTGSFKARGAVNSLLRSGAPDVVACSGGNHGLAVAWAAQRLGRRATVVVPLSASPTKVAAMQLTGAEVVQHGDIPAEAFLVAEQLVAERGWPLVHPYNQEATIEGQATIGLELLADAPSVSHWMIAIGGGGFAAGVALALRDRAEIVPVEPFGCPSLAEAQRTGGVVATKAEGIARTSLGPPALGELPWEVLRDAAVCSLVTDEAIVGAQQWLWSAMRVVAEPGGATALAALMSGAWVAPGGASVGVVVCGGNADSLPG